ncbi:ABC transporter permease [Micromonospora peucetia]|uniref:ABC transporter permease n=1 Tax=Micromonospora peucetia TaxID=47871 RepID=UPI003333F9D7
MNGSLPVRTASPAVGWLRLGYQSVLFSVAEMRAVHTWRTWLFGWVARLLTQVTFFALVGRFVADADTMRFVLVGNILALCCLESMIIVLTMAGERRLGTLPLLAIAPTGHVPVYLGRGLHWLASGIASSVIGWLTLPPLLGVALPWPEALLAMAMIPVVAIACYCYGCFLAGLAVRYRNLQVIVLNLGYLPIMAFCGVNVPLSFWPTWLQTIVNFLPLTHGLQAIRTVLAGGAGSEVLVQLALEVLVGAGWLAVAAASINRVVTRGRADGSLEFGS